MRHGNAHTRQGLPEQADPYSIPRHENRSYDSFSPLDSVRVQPSCLCDVRLLSVSVLRAGSPAFELAHGTPASVVLLPSALSDPVPHPRVRAKAGERASTVRSDCYSRRVVDSTLDPPPPPWPSLSAPRAGLAGSSSRTSNSSRPPLEDSGLQPTREQRQVHARSRMMLRLRLGS